MGNSKSNLKKSFSSGGTSNVSGTSSSTEITSHSTGSNTEAKGCQYDHNHDHDYDHLLNRLRREARAVIENEPHMKCLLHNTILHCSSTTFSAAISRTVSYRLSQSCGSSSHIPFCPNLIYSIIQEAFDYRPNSILPSSTPITTITESSSVTSVTTNLLLEAGYSMEHAVAEDALACVRRDPACDTLLEAVLFFKGFSSLVCHRAARYNWIGNGNNNGNGNSNTDKNNNNTNKTHNSSKTSSSSPKRFTALWLQSQASAAFGVDIHPAATIGAGVMFDHGTGIVIGETARIGDGCTLLHGVTLGGTGKESGDRHPKVGNHVLVGAGSKILGNVTIGCGAKIGAGSVVLHPIPKGATAVGAPAKIIGWAKETKPGSVIDNQLSHVTLATANEHEHEHDDDEEEDDDDDLSNTDENDDLSNTNENDDTSSTDENDNNNHDEQSVKRMDDDLPNNEPNKCNKQQTNIRTQTELQTQTPIILHKKRQKSHSLNSNTFDLWRSCILSCPKNHVPGNGISKCILQKYLHEQGSSEEEIDNVYFSLLRENPELGYIPKSTIVDKFTIIMKEDTTLDTKAIDYIRNKLLSSHRNSIS